MKLYARNDDPFFKVLWEEIWLPIKRRNDGRGEARAAFAKHVKAGADPEDIIAGARWYARSIPSGYEYVPLFSTWLNRGVWEDDCQRERAYQAKVAERAANVVALKPLSAGSVSARLLEGK